MTSIGNSNNQIQIWNNMEKLNTSKKTKIVSQKNKTNEYSCRRIFTPKNTAEDGGTNFFSKFCRRRFRCTIASMFKQKTLQRLLFFFWGNLVFRWGTLFSASVSKNFAGVFVVGYRRK